MESTLNFEVPKFVFTVQGRTNPTDFRAEQRVPPRLKTREATLAWIDENLASAGEHIAIVLIDEVLTKFTSRETMHAFNYRGSQNPQCPLANMSSSASEPGASKEPVTPKEQKEFTALCFVCGLRDDARKLSCGLCGKLVHERHAAEIKGRTKVTWRCGDCLDGENWFEPCFLQVTLDASKTATNVAIAVARGSIRWSGMSSLSRQGGILLPADHEVAMPTWDVIRMDSAKEALLIPARLTYLVLNYNAEVTEYVWPIPSLAGSVPTAKTITTLLFAGYQQSLAKSICIVDSYRVKERSSDPPFTKILLNEENRVLAVASLERKNSDCVCVLTVLSKDYHSSVLHELVRYMRLHSPLAFYKFVMRVSAKPVSLHAWQQVSPNEYQLPRFPVSTPLGLRF